MEAFSAAIEQKADGIELDVQLTKDGEIVVAHDERLERVSNGTGFLGDYTLDELKSLDFGKPLPDGKEYRIPTLLEVLSLVKTTSLTVNIELKNTVRLYPELPQKVIRLVKDFAMEEQVIYSSFNHYSLLELKKLEPSAKTGVLYEMGMVDPWVYAEYVKADSINPHYFVIAALPETVVSCHEKGIKVAVWNADDPQSISLMLKCGVDIIITKTPEAAIALRGEIL